MSNDAYLVTLEQEHWAAIDRACEARNEPECEAWTDRGLALAAAIKTTKPDGPAGLLAQWHYLRRSAEIAFMDDLDDFEQALRHFLRPRAVAPPPAV